MTRGTEKGVNPQTRNLHWRCGLRTLAATCLVGTLASGAAMGADSAVGTASGVFVCTDPSASLLWKTVTDERMEVSVDWPEGAAAATLTVTPDAGAATAVSVPAGSDTFTVEFALPEDEESERVVTLALAFTDSDGAAVGGSRRTATLGLVRGTSGRSARCVPNGASRRWGRWKANRAVIPVPEGAETVALDGGEAVAVDAPGWLAWSPLVVGAHGIACGDTTAAFEVVPGGGVILIH